MGFTQGNWTALADALKRHAAVYDVATIEDTRFGRRYTIEGRLDAPNGDAPIVRAVWFVEEGQAEPRFVTAYPIRGSRK